MSAVQDLVLTGVVPPLVRAAALLARERACRDHARQREGVAEQLLEPSTIALETREPPQRVPRGLRRRDLWPLSAVRERRPGRRGFVHRGDRGAVPEHEALGERVGG